MNNVMQSQQQGAKKDVVAASMAVPRVGVCPKCGQQALKCHDGNTVYFRCVADGLLLPDGSAYPVVYSAEWYTLHGVKTL